MSISEGHYVLTGFILIKWNLVTSSTSGFSAAYWEALDEESKEIYMEKELWAGDNYKKVR